MGAKGRSPDGNLDNADRLNRKCWKWLLAQEGAMSIEAVIADNRKAIEADAAQAHSVFAEAITYRVWAAQLGIELDSVSVRVEGDLDLRGFFGLDDTVRPGFTAVRVEVSVSGPESAERYAELAARVDEHCPVLDLFKNPVPVTRELTAVR
jgi:putative redox protein